MKSGSRSPLAIESELVAAMVTEDECQAVPFERRFAVSEGFLHLVVAVEVELDKVAVDAAVYGLALGVCLTQAPLSSPRCSSPKSGLDTT